MNGFLLASVFSAGNGKQAVIGYLKLPSADGCPYHALVHEQLEGRGFPFGISIVDDNGTVQRCRWYSHLDFALEEFFAEFLPLAARSAAPERRDDA